GLLRYEPGASFPLHRHDFAQVWYILEGEFCCGGTTYGPGTFVYMPDPHFEHEMTTKSGGTVVFLQYPGPTTGARLIYEGGMNVTKPESPQEYDLNRWAASAGAWIHRDFNFHAGAVTASQPAMLKRPVLSFRRAYPRILIFISSSRQAMAT